MKRILFFIYTSNMCVKLSNLKSKNLIQIQLIGYLLAILMSPISIDIIVDESFDHVRWINFPILSFITWILLIVLPVVYAYIKRIEYNAYYYRPVSSSAMHNISMKSLT